MQRNTYPEVPGTSSVSTQGVPPTLVRGASRALAGRTSLAFVLVLLTLVLSACAEARVHYTFEEDGSYRVEGSVSLGQRDAPALERLLGLRGRLESAGLTTADLTEPGRLGFTFNGDSANDTWTQQQAGGGPRLRTEQGLLSKKFVLYWPFDWDVYLEGVAPEGIGEGEAALFRTSDIRVTATFPGGGARHNGSLEAGSDGRTVEWTVLPLEPGFIRAEYSFLVWWRAALVPVFVVAVIVLLFVRRYLSLRAVPRVGETVVQGGGAASGRLRATGGFTAPATPPAVTASASCPVCDAPIVPGETCARCVATVEAAGGA